MRIMKSALNPFLNAMAESLKRTLIFLSLLVALLILIYMVAWMYHAIFGTLGGNA